MASHNTPTFNPDQKFEFTGKMRKTLLGIIAVGIVLLVAGVFMASGSGNHKHAEEPHSLAKTEQVLHASAEEPAQIDAHKQETHSTENQHQSNAHANESDHGHHASPTWLKRLYTTLWVNNLFFVGLAIIGVFFVAVNYIAMAGWSTPIKRVPESMGFWLPIAGALMLVLFVTGKHDLFHWTHAGLTDPNSHEYDELIASKTWYLDVTSYIVRMVIYFVAWILLFMQLRKLSLREDELGTTEPYYKSIKIGAIFVVVFAVTSSMAAWDWGMSIDPHWFSTLYGWYFFASWFVSGMAFITLITIFLKKHGYLEMVNENHLHDLGKFMFAFSIFWTYLWFAQFLLIYYANIPEETLYFMDRLNHWDQHYRPFFFGVLLINFIFPFLALMTRGSKRQPQMLTLVAVVILIGHWLDFFLMITPGVMKGEGTVGVMEIGTLLIFLGSFLYVVLSKLGSRNLIPKNHPMLQESLHHDI